jgi:uncharacterized glyoxalase superfamily metalloenzyme YdcJ
MSFIDADQIRSRFARAMSDMYRAEVPQYGTLVDLVDRVNGDVLAADPTLADRLARGGELERLAGERHGAIRVGNAAELSLIRRAFALMDMRAVGYYDLAAAGVPVHSTAFRPIDRAGLQRNPFRVFTSLLRLDLIADADLRGQAAAALDRRRIMTPAAEALVERAEAEGGLDEEAADDFVRELIETFRWHAEAVVDQSTYAALVTAHRLIADVVSFRGPHINHLTPRTLDIDAIQAAMPLHGMNAKEAIEGPPRRRCPVLLRQTSFKALDEAIAFPDADGRIVAGSHSARFGEVEQRGVALTPKGRALYDRLLAAPGDGFGDLPDDWIALREQGLAYFRYRITGTGEGAVPASLDDAIRSGHVAADPIIYEDFLPVSAAGIFQSNLGGEVRAAYHAGGARDRFEMALGGPVLDEFALYAVDEAQSRREVEALLTAARPAA